MNDTMASVTTGDAGDNEWTVGSNIIRHRATGHRLLALHYHLAPDDTTVIIDGVDQPGVLLYVTGLFRKFELSYNVYVGERGHHGQGSRCELPDTPRDWRQLRRMHDHVRQNPHEFAPRPLVQFDRVYSMTIRMPQDECGLMCRPAAFFAERDINLRYVRAEKDEARSALGLPEVKVVAQLEVPGIETIALKRGLQEMCPANSEVSLDELWRRADCPCHVTRTLRDG